MSRTHIFSIYCSKKSNKINLLPPIAQIYAAIELCALSLHTIALSVVQWKTHWNIAIRIQISLRENPSYQEIQSGSSNMILPVRSIMQRWNFKSETLLYDPAHIAAAFSMSGTQSCFPRPCAPKSVESVLLETNQLSTIICMYRCQQSNL